MTIDTCTEHALESIFGDPIITDHDTAVDGARRTLTACTLTTIDGADLDLDKFRGRPLLVILGTRRTQSLVRRAVWDLRSHPATASIDVLQIAQLSDVPEQLHRMARAHVLAGYRSQLADLSLLFETGIERGSVITQVSCCVDSTSSTSTAFAHDPESPRPLIVLCDSELNEIVATPATNVGHASLRNAALRYLPER